MNNTVSSGLALLITVFLNIEDKECVIAAKYF